MPADLRLRLLAREVELKSYFGSIIAEDLEEMRREPDKLDEQLALLTALVSTALKASRLLWRYGQRATDRIGGDKADILRRELQLDAASPLSPERVGVYTPVLHLPPLELAEAWDPAANTVDLDGTVYPVTPLQDALRQLHGKLGSGGVQ